MTVEARSPFPDELAGGNIAWHRFKRGGTGSDDEVRGLLTRCALGRLTERFQSLPLLNRARAIRLCRHRLDGFSADRWHHVLQQTRFADGLIELLDILFREILGLLSRDPDRDEDQRFKQAVKTRLSYEIHGRLVDALTLKKPLERLAGKDSRSLRCVLMKFYLSCTYEEIAEAERLSVQMVRTRIEKAIRFLADQLS